MQAEFKKIKPFLYEFKLINVPYTVEDTLTEINSYNYTEWNKVGSHRFTTSNSSAIGPVITDFGKFFTSAEFQNSLFELMGTDEKFWSDYWKEDPETFKKFTEPSIELDIDLPGFHMPIHIDNRSMVIVGMCHFIPNDNPDQSTYFYSNEHGDNPIRIPTGFCTGWVSANLHNTWHSGHNTATTNRASIKFGVQLKFKSSSL